MDSNIKGVILAMVFSIITSISVGYVVIKVSLAEQGMAIGVLKEKVEKNDYTMEKLNDTLVSLQLTLGRLDVLIEERRENGRSSNIR